MTGTILSLFGVCLAAALGELLLPKTASAGTRKLLHFLTGLLVLVLILTPFLGFLQEHGSFLEGEIAWEEEPKQDFEQIFRDAIKAQSGEDLKEGLYALLATEYGIARKDCSIVILFSGEGDLMHVSVFLSGEALFQNPERLETALQKKLQCTVEVR